MRFGVEVSEERLAAVLTAESVPFEPGKVGADRTQVLSGLREGQQVVLPAAR